MSKAEQPAQDPFLTYLVHDLEPAMASFQTLLRLLKQKRYAPDNPMHGKLVHSCDAALQFSLGLLRDMLEFSKMKRMDWPVHPASFAWSGLFDECLALASVLAADREVAINGHSLDTADEFMSDACMIKRIVVNLLTNAIKNVDRGDKVQLRYTRTDKGALIQVENKVDGMDEAFCNRIFDEHVQLPAHDGKRAYRGVGLGLSYCRAACERLRGSIAAELHDQGRRLRMVLELTPWPSQSNGPVDGGED